MLSEEQTKKLKAQLITHIEKSFPADKKGFAISQINSMDSEQLEEFLRQNQLIKNSSNVQQPTQCVFCAIVAGQIHSHKLAESEEATAVLEINPVSQGHSIVIPKEHIASPDKLKKSIFSLAKIIAKRIRSKLSPKDVTLVASNIMGHEIINIVPVYTDETINSERKHLEHQELADLQKVLHIKEKKSPKVRKEKKDSTPEKNSEPKRWIPRRIP